MRADDRSTQLSPEEIEALLEHEEFVRQISLRFTHDRELAEDVAQQVWVAALSHPPRHQKNLRGWLSRLVRTSLADRLRSEGRRRDHEFVFARDLPRAVEPGETPREYSALFAALSELSPKYQEVVRLRYMEGFGRMEIAECLGLSVDTVKTRQRRALEQLRRRLGPRRTSLTILAPLLTRIEERWPTLVPAAPAKLFLLAGSVLATLLMAIGWSLFVRGARGSDDAVALSLESIAVADPGSAASGAPAALDDDAGQRDAVADAAAAAGDEARVPEPRRLVLRALWRDTGVPARGVPVVAELGGAPGRRATTDVSGEVSFDGLEPGVWCVSARLGRPQHVRVEPEGTVRHEWHLPRGLTVRGTVQTTHSDRPVEGLRIWTSFPGRKDVGELRGVSGADGKFEVEGVDPGAWVGAQENGRFRSTKLLGARTAHVGSMPVVLPVSEALHALVSGRVLDEQGLPIAGASVWLSMPHDPDAVPRVDNDGRRWARVPWEEAVTDPGGRYAIEGPSRRGVHTVAARAPGRVEQVQSAELPLADGALDFTLYPGLSVVGRLTVGSGAAAAGAVVSATWPGAPRPRTARAMLDGEFEFQGLPADGVRLSAHGVDVRGEAIWGGAQVTGPAAPDAAEGREVPGGPVRWDGVLQPGRGVSGTVVDVEGAPLPGWIVHLVQDGRKAVTLSDGAGRFCFSGVESRGDLVLEVSPPGRSHWALARRTDVRAGPTQVRLQVDAAEVRACALRGRLTGSDGQPVGGMEVEARSQRLREPLAVVADPTTGAFAFEELPPGDCDVFLRVDAGEALALATSVALTGSRDLGALRAPTPGALRVWLHGAEGDERIPAQLTVSRHGPDGLAVVRRADTIFPDQGWFEVGPLPAGRYRLTATAKRRVRTEVDVELGSGEVEEVRIGLERGVRVQLVLDYPTSPGPVTSLELDISRSNGRSFLEVRGRAELEGGTFTRAVALPADTLVVEGRLRDGESVIALASVELHVSTGMEGQQALLRLRPIEADDR